MEVVALSLPGAAEIRATPHRDERGHFVRWFCQEELAPVNGGRRIEQVNASLTRQTGTVRGLHFRQPPHEEDRSVRCIAGRVFDVLVDLRQGSPTFGRWQGLVLDAEEMNMVYVPRGFAHGFQTLEPDCRMLYLHTAFHVAEAEAGLAHDSPELGIEWPLPVSLLSERDRRLPAFDPSWGGLEL
jgi:dTDP-4-dehydrorhamnose 3,5-epimerase